MNKEQLDAEANAIDLLLSEAVENKNYQELETLSKRVDDLAAARKAFEQPDPRIAAVMRYGGDLASTPPAVPVGKKALGKHVSPLSFSRDELHKAFNAIKHGQNYVIQSKAFSSVDSLLPAQLAPGIIPEEHEWRIMDHLPVMPISAPSIEFIIHNYSGDSGGPAVVAEGAAKPEYVPASTSSTTTAVKLATHTGISSESLLDAPQWESYIVNQCYRLIMDLENSQFLYGSGSGGNITGFANTSGILTHNASSDPSGSTNLDSVELAINALRVYSGVFATPQIAITSPTTWSATRRIKSTIDTYIAGDPLHEAVTTVWGVPVLVTTACNDGEMFLIDRDKMGFVVLREGLSMHTGYSGTDLIDNIVRFVFEERLGLAVERPQAIMHVTNLDT
jgi:HK97 family phage major capsid protein